MMTRNLNSSQREKVVLCRGLKIRMTADFLSAIISQKKRSKVKTERFQTHRPQFTIKNALQTFFFQFRSSPMGVLL